MIAVGDTLYGFCHGVFGRDSYGDKCVLHVGKVPPHSWATARDGFVGEEEYIVVSEDWWGNAGDDRFQLVHAAQGKNLLEELAPYLTKDSDLDEVYR